MTGHSGRGFGPRQPPLMPKQGLNRQSISCRKIGSGLTICSYSPLHPVIIRAAAPLGGHPVDDLVRIHDVAGLAMHAVGEVDVDLLAGWFTRLLHHLVHRSGTEMLAGVAEFLHTTMVTNIQVANHQVYGLVIIVTRP